MTIILDDGEGHRCDATCYNAKGAGCDCICGGDHHGVGLDRALELSEGHEWAEFHFKLYYRVSGQWKLLGVVAESEMAETEKMLLSWMPTATFKSEQIEFEE